MKNNIRQISFSLVIASFLGILVLSCEDYRMNKMVDDQIYFLEFGFVAKNIPTLEKSTLELYVIKSGVGQQGAEVYLDIDPDALAEYNAENSTSYMVLPPEYYTLKSNKLVFPKEGYKDFFQFDLDTDRISALQEDGDTYVIPCRLRVENSSIAFSSPERAILLVSPVVIEPYVEFVKQMDSMEYPFSVETVGYHFELRKTYDWSEEVRVEIDLDEALIDEYNAANNTSYTLLPSAVIDNMTPPFTAVIPGNGTTVNYHLNLVKEGFRDSKGNFLFGEFMLPLRITGVSANKINERKSVFLLQVSFSPTILNPLERWAKFNVGELNTFATGDEKTASGMLYQYGRNIPLPPTGNIPIVRGVTSPTDPGTWTNTNTLLLQPGSAAGNANWYSEVRTDLDSWKKVVAETNTASGVPSTYFGSNGGDPCPAGWRVPKINESYSMIYGGTVNFVTLTAANDVRENNIDLLGNNQVADYTADYKKIDATTVVALRFKNTVYASAFRYKLVDYPTAGSAHIEITAKLVPNSVTIGDVETFTGSDWADAEIRYIPIVGYRLHANGAVNSLANSGKETYFWVDQVTSHTQTISHGFVGWNASNLQFGTGMPRYRNTAICVRCIKDDK
ncbi:DUF1735 domain-containing protein [Proteiniphilum sp. X52]|uniref:DUF1735 domain-containing protein n=1 Tax=Proteiniphilum sp. X52 TaxID=2382159 RepID=UPI000F09D817|nr:DUF1735 domain-containing protein [Proteiniphilum sp. X52]RNC66795.1 DUF1735 domain-containing protein [Proteiniphilum sp. X52]